MVTKLLIILLQHFNSCLLKQEGSPYHFSEQSLRFLPQNLFQITQNWQKGTLTELHAVTPSAGSSHLSGYPGTDPATQQCSSLLKHCSHSLCNIYLFRPHKFQLIHKDVLNSSPESLTPTMSSLPTTELSVRGNNTRHVFILFWCSELHHTCSVLSLCPNSLPRFLFV